MTCCLLSMQYRQARTPTVVLVHRAGTFEHLLIDFDSNLGSKTLEGRGFDGFEAVVILLEHCDGWT